MDLESHLNKLSDAQLFCSHCASATDHRQYDNGRQRLYLCSVCATLTTSKGRDRASTLRTTG